VISEAEFDSSQKRLYATTRNNRNKNYLESVILWLVQASALVLPSPFLIMDRRSEESRKNPRRFSNKILPKPQTIWQPTQRWRMGFAMSMCQGELADRKMRGAPIRSKMAAMSRGTSQLCCRRKQGGPYFHPHWPLSLRVSPILCLLYKLSTPLTFHSTSTIIGGLHYYY